MTKTKIKLKPVLSEAWAKVKGTKKYFFMVLLALMMVQLVLFILQFLGNDYLPKTFWVNLVLNMAFVLLSSPFMAGFMMLGVQSACAKPLGYRSGFSWFNLKMLLKLFALQLMVLFSVWAVLYIAFILITGLISLVTHLDAVAVNIIAAILGTIFLLIFFSLQVLFSFAFIALIDQRLSPWQAYKCSILMAWPHLGLLIMADVVCLLFDFVGVIPFGVGLLWTIPFSFIVTGIFYREISKSLTK